MLIKFATRSIVAVSLATLLAGPATAEPPASATVAARSRPAARRPPGPFREFGSAVGCLALGYGCVFGRKAPRRSG